jgi:hypothetical protein
MERTVQVGIARPTVTEDPGTSDMYSNWRPGHQDDQNAGALVALPLHLSTAKKIGGIAMDDQEVIAAANNYTLRTAMERIEMDNDTLDSAEVVVVDQKAYDERIQYNEPPRKRDVQSKQKAMVRAMAEKLEESYAPVESKMGGFTLSRMADMKAGNNLASRELSFRSLSTSATSFDKSLEMRDGSYRQTVMDSRFLRPQKFGR